MSPLIHIILKVEGEQYEKKVTCCFMAIVILMLCGCGPNNGGVNKVDTENVTDKNNDIIESKESIVDTEKTGTKENLDNLTKDLLLELFKMDKEEILEYFGSDYEVIYTGVEGSDVGYEYKNGVLIVFTETGNSISRMELSDNIIFEGVHAGMKFDEIKKIMGDAKIQEADYETHIVYALRYNLDTNVRCSFISYSKDGNESELVIH